MAKHMPATIWALRRVGKYPQAYVRTVDEKSLNLSFFPDPPDVTPYGYGFDIPRRDARLLARRILRCLEDTK